MSHKYDVCPFCGQGELCDAMIKVTQENVIVCDECDSLWKGGHTPIAADNACDISEYLKKRGLEGVWKDLKYDDGDKSEE